MIIEQLSLSNFRCWSYHEQELTPKLNYVSGDNGTGKTSLLEAVNYLSTGQSFRTHRDHECIRWNNSSFMIRGNFTRPSNQENSGPETSISFFYGRKENNPRRKIAKVNEETLPRLSLLRNYSSCVVFSPDHLKILKQGPSLRRDFLDELLASINPSFMETVKDYDRNRKQRNELLKSNNPDELLLEQYEEKLTEHGSEIQRERERILPILEEKFVEQFESLPLQYDQNPSIDYQPDISSTDKMEEIWSKSRSLDMERGHTTRGPHRDDWMIQIEARPVDRFASRGEIRILLLALKLAQASLIIKCSNNVPILLFDDVESELDEEAQTRFIEVLKDHPSQVIVTGVGELLSNAEIGDPQVIHI